MRGIMISLMLVTAAACAPTSSVDEFNAQSETDRRAAINACLAEVGRSAAPVGPLRIEPPLTPQEGSVFAACLGR